MPATTTFIVKISHGDTTTEVAVVAACTCDAVMAALEGFAPDDPVGRIDVEPA
jgi:hypothetical protein